MYEDHTSDTKTAFHCKLAEKVKSDNTSLFFDLKQYGQSAVLKQIFKYIQIFEYFSPNIDICIRFVAIFKAEYYSNIFVRIYPNIGL